MGKRGAISGELPCTRGYITDCISPKNPFQAGWLAQHQGKRGHSFQSRLPLCLCPGLCAASDSIPGILQRAGEPEQDALCTMHLHMPAQRNISYSQARNWRAKKQPCYPSTITSLVMTASSNISPNPLPLASSRVPLHKERGYITRNYSFTHLC